MTIKNYSQLSSIAKKKVKDVGYTPDADGKTASRKPNKPTTQVPSAPVVPSAPSAPPAIKPTTSSGPVFSTVDAALGQSQSPQLPVNPLATPTNIQTSQPLQPGNILPSSLSPGQQFSSLPPENQLAQAPKQSLLEKLQAKYPQGVYDPNTAIQGTLPFASMFSPAGNVAMFTKQAATTVSKAGKIGTIPKPATSTVTSFANNTKTQKLTRTYLEKVGNHLKNPKSVAIAITAALGTYPWNWHLKTDNLLGGYEISIRDAHIRGDEEGAAVLQSELDEVLNPTLWERIVQDLPFSNLAHTYIQNLEKTHIVNAVNKKYWEDKKIQQTTGETEDQKWARLAQEQADQDKAAVDYYNQERKKMLSWEQEARASAAATTRAEEVKARNEDAAFWAKEREKQAEKEAEDRKAIADYWAAYRKASQKAYEDNRPSKLNFGIV